MRDDLRRLVTEERVYGLSAFLACFLNRYFLSIGPLNSFLNYTY